MTLSNDQEQELNDILHALQDYYGDMSQRERSFVEDQVKRYDEYKSGMRLSDKQWKWLRDLHRKYAE